MLSAAVSRYICQTSIYGFPINFSFRRGLSKKSKRLSYYHNPGSEPLRQVTVGKLLDEAAETWPERPAIISVYQNQILTYGQAQQQANKLAAGFISLGLKPGDRLAILSVSSVQWYLTMMAAAKAGLILVNINPAFLKQELEYCLRKVGVRALVSQENFRTQEYYKTLCNMVPEIEKSKPGTEIRNKHLPDLTHFIVMTEKQLPGAYRFSDVSEMEKKLDEVEKLEREIQPDDPCNIQFSSGTTGKAKAALLSHFMIANNSYFFGKRLGYHKKHHKLCIQVPMFHTFGATLGILSSLNHGATLVLPSPTFKAESTIEALKKVRCSIIYGTPTMYIDLCSAIDGKLQDDEELRESVKEFDIVVSGGAVCTPLLFQRISKTLNCTNVASAYGMTETSPIMMQNTEKDSYEQKVTTVGFVAEHAEVKVVDEKGRMVPMGTPGEVWFRSYATMIGYFDDEEHTKNAITPCRWIKSGDLFILNENGYGQVVGRLKDVIIRGGENIFPVEIEEFLSTHPDIKEVQVYGVSDERMSEEVCVSVKLKPNTKMTAQQLKDFCRGKIAHFKIPRYVQFVDDFPKTASGKVKKFVLRELMEKQLKDQEKR